MGEVGPKGSDLPVRQSFTPPGSDRDEYDFYLTARNMLYLPDEDEPVL